jgi:hypothetical protein
MIIEFTINLVEEKVFLNFAIILLFKQFETQKLANFAFRG